MAKTKGPLLPVIIPLLLYNGEKSIPEALPSLLDFCRSCNWKPLLVNNGSTNASHPCSEGCI
ncbi:MAG: hypothetical protein FD146_1497 [Anaerolineaceae bacterium]|nr:MAG: hypothetical protein FD146_1497 [Anaerolineaceae bacterium]